MSQFSVTSLCFLSHRLFWKSLFSTMAALIEDLTSKGCSLQNPLKHPHQAVSAHLLHLNIAAVSWCCLGFRCEDTYFESLLHTCDVNSEKVKYQCHTGSWIHFQHDVAADTQHFKLPNDKFDKSVFISV